ncbi:YjfB family protein [Virgibacillus sp. FSP13]
MDVAAMSVVMANSQLRSDASLAIMDKSMGVMEQQGQQMMEMLQKSAVPVTHPTLGNAIDVKI